MATLASRSPYAAPSFANSMPPTQYRVPAPAMLGGNHPTAAGVFTSPTESEFSESYKDSARDSVQEWDEARVGDWLRSINCGQYVELFRRHNINGENLLDMDQATLKEMGIKKVGDRVRIGAQAKVFRNNVYKQTSKRTINRVSLHSRLSGTPSTNHDHRTL